RAGRRDAHRPPLGGSARRAAEDLRGLRPAHHVDPGTGQPRPGARSPVQLPPQSAGRRLHTAGPYPRGPAARARSNDMITDFPAEPLPPPSPGDATAELAALGGPPIIPKPARRTIYPVITKEDV